MLCLPLWIENYMEPTFNMHHQRPRAKLCAACDCSVLTGDLTGFRLELGFHWDGSSVAQEAKNIVPFPSELFCVVCLRLGWVILKEIKRKALHVAGRCKHKANNCESLFSNTQATRWSEVSKLCYVLEYLRAFKNPTSQFTPNSNEVTLTGGESQTAVFFKGPRWFQ